jgi:hypothetical protein
MRRVAGIGLRRLSAVAAFHIEHGARDVTLVMGGIRAKKAIDAGGNGLL